MKSTKSEQQLVNMGQTGVEGLPVSLIRFIGITELLGAAGIILPWYFQVMRVLTPVTAVGFAIIMVPAGIIHIRRKEYKTALGNLALLMVAVVVAIGRF